VSCTLCKNGYLNRGDMECVNGVLIDIDEAHEGAQMNVSYPPAPCQACPSCEGMAYTGEVECPDCNETGWLSGCDESRERLAEWARGGNDEVKS